MRLAVYAFTWLFMVTSITCSVIKLVPSNALHIKGRPLATYFSAVKVVPVPNNTLLQTSSVSVKPVSNTAAVISNIPRFSSPVVVKQMPQNISNSQASTSNTYNVVQSPALHMNTYAQHTQPVAVTHHLVTAQPVQPAAIVKPYDVPVLAQRSIQPVQHLITAQPIQPVVVTQPIYKPQQPIMQLVFQPYTQTTSAIHPLNNQNSRMFMSPIRVAVDQSSLVPMMNGFNMVKAISKSVGVICNMLKTISTRKPQINTQPQYFAPTIPSTTYVQPSAITVTKTISMVPTQPQTLIPAYTASVVQPSTVIKYVAQPASTEPKILQGWITRKVLCNTVVARCIVQNEMQTNERTNDQTDDVKQQYTTNNNEDDVNAKTNVSENTQDTANNPNEKESDESTSSEESSDSSSSDTSDRSVDDCTERQSKPPYVLKGSENDQTDNEYQYQSSPSIGNAISYNSIGTGDNQDQIVYLSDLI
ncbi:hypothetical protein CWI42_091830 [Ordospora colligata]|nr:hypothetical protein CWI40_091840 [Ordospora colligata]TBU18095.1 hypothetical protein CWI42_091830 [Ordospora colligata]